MSAALNPSDRGLGETPPASIAWLAALVGFLALYGPVYWHSFNTHWNKEEHAHAPIILMIAGWLVWQKRDQLLGLVQASKDRSLAGWGLLLLGLFMYVLGRTLSFSIMEFAAQPLVALGCVVITGGWAAARVLWFPVLFLLFMIPMPGSLIDAATGALKQWVSVTAEWLLATANYPVGRSGVMLTVGQYHLLVADACSGLHSIFTLTAMGILLLYLKARANLLHQLVMIAAILPIAFAANTIRVMTLVLVTYHLGDEAGQGFLHGAAGIVLIVVALLGFILLDGLLAMALKKRVSQH